MAKRSRLDVVTASKLPPGAWMWDGGIGYRRNANGDGGTWYIKYRAPMAGSFPQGVKPPMRQVKERLPNCRNKSQAEGVLMARRAAIFEGTFQPRRTSVQTSVADFAPPFLRAKRHLRTAKKYRQQLDQHIAPHFGKKPLEAITGQDCLDYYNKRLDTDAAISTVNGEVATFRGDPRRRVPS